jgi:hypothetical protein
MGATVFSTVGRGDTVAEAYRQAVDDAFYWHGHGGYTGTIAEKDGYHLVDVPPFPESDDRINDFDRFVNALNWYMGDDRVWEAEPEFDWAKSAKADAIYLREQLGADGLRDVHAYFDAKWGPAVAVKIADGEYGFCGWASC